MPEEVLYVEVSQAMKCWLYPRGLDEVEVEEVAVQEVLDLDRAAS